MTTSTAYAASVTQFVATSAPSGITDKGSTTWSSVAGCPSWVNQSGGAISASSFNDTGGDYGTTNGILNDNDSDPLLLYNFAANWSSSITSGATISAISGTINRTEGTSTNAGAALYDLCVFLRLYNGSDLTSGGLGSNQAATSTVWPKSGSPTSNFQAANYTFTTTTYSNVTNSNFGVVVGVDGSQSSKSAFPYIQYVQLSVTWSASGSAPGQVTGLSVTNDSTNPTTALDLSWSTPSGSPTSYTIQRASTLGGTFSTLATGVTGTTYVDSTCSPGTEYAYEVAGVNGVGTGTYSSAAANFTDPSAPGSLAATAESGSQINVSWSAPSLGSTVSVVQYTLNRQTNGGSFSTIYTGSTASYSDTGLAAGTTYGYEIDVEVEVTDTSGSGLSGDLTSAFSAVVSATTFGTGAPVPLFGLEGTGACPFGVTHPTRRTRIEGVRFQHRNG
ncbi:MAG TPA: fibronectin type III domain-containing protein [Planctomycetaceae bacterium]|jgi:cellulose 1,4-beta-cellobiosidase|nr:fibronectin type III domain-containing protein [Planctomycetaceae bacterium]